MARDVSEQCDTPPALAASWQLAIMVKTEEELKAEACIQVIGCHILFLYSGGSVYLYEHCLRCYIKSIQGPVDILNVQPFVKNMKASVSTTLTYT